MHKILEPKYNPFLKGRCLSKIMLELIQSSSPYIGSALGVLGLMSRGRFRSYLLMPICLFTFSCQIVLEKEIIDLYIDIYMYYICIYYLVKVT